MAKKITTPIATPISPERTRRRRVERLAGNAAALAADAGGTAVADEGSACECVSEAAATVEPGEAIGSFPELPLALDPRLIRFRSALSSAADWHRRSASFSSAFMTTSLSAVGSERFN